MKVFVDFESVVMKTAVSSIGQKFEVVDDISSAELIITDNLNGLQKALLNTKNVEIWMPFATAGESFEKEFGFKKLVEIKQANPRIKIFDAFGREGSEGDPLDFFNLLKS